MMPFFSQLYSDSIVYEAVWPLGIAIRGSVALRNRMLANPSFLFKVFVEVLMHPLDHFLYVDNIKQFFY